MIALIKKVIQLAFYSPYRRVKKDKLVEFGNSILGRSFKIDYRVPREIPSLKIGDGCILMQENIFESDKGFISIGNGTFINGRTKLISRSSITVGNNVTIAWGCTIYDHDSHSLNYQDRIADQAQQIIDWQSGCLISNKNWTNVSTKPIVIGDNVWIGFDVVILKGVSIGEGAIVGARSVVTHDIPAWTVAAGNPARVVKTLVRPSN